MYDFAEYERRREQIEERIRDFPSYVRKVVSEITLAKTAGRPKKFSLVKRTHLFFLVRVFNKSNRDTKALLGLLLQPFIEDEISYKYIGRLYSDEQVEMVLHNVFVLMLRKDGVSGEIRRRWYRVLITDSFTQLRRLSPEVLTTPHS